MVELLDDWINTPFNIVEVDDHAIFVHGPRAFDSDAIVVPVHRAALVTGDAEVVCCTKLELFKYGRFHDCDRLIASFLSVQEPHLPQGVSSPS